MVFMPVPELSIQVKNQPGQIVRISTVLAQAHINVHGITALSTAKLGWVRMVVDDAKRAEEALESRGLTVEMGEAVAVMMHHEPGELDRALGILAEAKINLDYIYTCVERNAAMAMVILGVQSTDKVERLLHEHGIRLAGVGERPF
jgi:hypothetical protein